MTAHSDDQPHLSKQERQRMHDEIRRIAAEMRMAHSMSDQESEEALLDVHLDDRQQRLQTIARQ